MSRVGNRTIVRNVMVCGVAIMIAAGVLTNSASAIHRRGRIAYGAVAGADVIAYNRPAAIAPGIAGNPVGFGFGGYNYGGYPLYGYAQYLPAAYDGYGAVGYTPAVAVGLPGGYGSTGAYYSANLGAASADPYMAGYAPADIAAACPPGVAMSPRAYRRYVRRMCRAMARLTWVYFPMTVPMLDCYGDLLGDDLGLEQGVEEIEALQGINPSAEEIHPQSIEEEPMPEGSRPGEKTLSIDSLRPESLEPPVNEEGPSLRYLLERDL